MKTITKLGIAAGVLGLLYVAKKAKDTLANFQFAITGYGRPALSGTSLTVPLQVSFDNPTPLPISIDNLIADIFIDKAGQWVKAAHIQQPVSIPPGKSTQTISPKVDLKALIGGSAMDTINAIDLISKSRSVNVKGEVIAVYKGISLPQQTFTKNFTF